ncbi:helix-turn-helix transcriptional regulator [Azospirillum sp. Vi22]|uniref:helix-turn-helix domain-containing protein n=1 Tax=Azospirillum baldaniorum TaxID=1064539 RepID=UPI00157A56CC|nr:helix-turn-helix transcriptional regulator [Azospirillum baldaniorum]NUB07119.1 helix-turn-helix transcriptional regulator [Azospirillum baldaniorum]
MEMTPPQCRAARALIDWSQAQLSEAANVGLSTVKSFESGNTRPMKNNLLAMQHALEAAGVIFIPENGEGPGVRMRKQVSDDGVSETIEGLASE